MATRRYDITAGPNKFDLMLALFEEKEILFTLKGVKGPLKSLVTSIGLYSKEEEKYEIRGQLVPQDWQKFCANPTSYDFHGYFDCRNRTGILDFQAEACWKEQLDKELEACWQVLNEHKMPH